MGGAILSTKEMVHRIPPPGRGNDEEIRRLEKRALDYPEARDEILCTLDGYAYRLRGTPDARAARDAAKRIAAVSMLEALCGDDARY